MFDCLKESVTEEIFKRIVDEFPYMLADWDEECRKYLYEMTDDDIGECGENLTRFQASVFGEGIEEYLDETKEK